MKCIPEYVQSSNVIMCSPQQNVLSRIDHSNYSQFLFRAPVIDSDLFIRQHNILVSTLKLLGLNVTDIVTLDLPTEILDLVEELPNLIFTRDSALTLPSGGIILNMATEQRKKETVVMEAVYRAMRIPIIRKAPPEAIVEGGDIIFVSSDIVFMGFGPRTTLEGVRFMKTVLIDELRVIREIVAFSISPERINLDGVLMPIRRDLLLANTSALSQNGILLDASGERPVKLADHLSARKIDLIDISHADGYMLSTNLFHLDHKHLIAYSHNEATNNLLAECGYTVHGVDGSELVKGSGGPRCMTNVIRYPMPV